MCIFFSLLGKLAKYCQGPKQQQKPEWKLTSVSSFVWPPPMSGLCASSNWRCIIWWYALAKRSSQLKPTRAKFTTSMELGIVWPSTWLGSARGGSSWLEFDQARIFAQLEPSFPPFGQLNPTVAKLFCHCYMTTRSYSDNRMVSCELAWLGGIVWPPADASFDFVTWIGLGLPFGQA